MDLERRVVDASVPAGATALPAIAAAMGTAGVLMDDLGKLRPSLDDVFLTLTGHATDPVTAPIENAEPA